MLAFKLVNTHDFNTCEFLGWTLELITISDEITETRGSLKPQNLLLQITIPSTAGFTSRYVPLSFSHSKEIWILIHWILCTVKFFGPMNNSKLLYPSFVVSVIISVWKISWYRKYTLTLSVSNQCFMELWNMDTFLSSI